MLPRAFFVSLVSINLLQLLWLFSYKKILYFRETLLLSVLLIILFIVGWFTDDSFIILLLIPFFSLQFYFLANRVKNWLIPVLFLSFEIAIVLLSWFVSLDFWDVLLLQHLISAETYSKYLNLIILLQQFVLFLLLMTARYLNKRWSITITLHLLPKKYRLLSIFLLLFLFFMVVVQQLSAVDRYSTPFFSSSFMIICFTAFLSWNVLLVVKYLNEKQYIMVLNEKYEREKDKIDRSNEFRHDYKHLLIGLSSYLAENDTQQALKLLHTIIDYSDSQLTPNLYNTIAMIQSPPIQGLLTSFIKRCSEADVRLEIQITEQLTNFDMNIVDFIRSFSILLDNAFEATQETDDPFIEVMITGNSKSIKVQVRNTFNEDKTIAFHTFLQNNFSTKENHQGKGLYIFTKLIDKYKKSSYQISKRDMYFIASFSIPKLKNVGN